MNFGGGPEDAILHIKRKYLNNLIKETTVR